MVRAFAGYWEIGPVNHKILKLSGRKTAFHIVHVERLKQYHELTDEEIVSDKNLERRQQDILNLHNNEGLLCDLFTKGQFFTDKESVDSRDIRDNEDSNLKPTNEKIQPVRRSSRIWEAPHHLITEAKET